MQLIKTERGFEGTEGNIKIEIFEDNMRAAILRNGECEQYLKLEFPMPLYDEEVITASNVVTGDIVCEVTVTGLDYEGGWKELADVLLEIAMEA